MKKQFLFLSFILCSMQFLFANKQEKITEIVWFVEQKKFEVVDYCKDDDKKGTSFTSKTDEQEMAWFVDQLALVIQVLSINEFAPYPEKAITASTTFGDKYGHGNKLECTACDEGLNAGGFNGNILMALARAMVDASNVSAVQALMEKSNETLGSDSLDDILQFMLLTANELPISCERCSGTSWSLIDNA